MFRSRPVMASAVAADASDYDYDIFGEKKRSFRLEEMYDMSSYTGRLVAMINRTNPLLFFHSKERILLAKESIDDAKDQKHLFLTEDEIKEYRVDDAIVSSTIHPDTGKIIPHWQRVSGQLFFNLPTAFVMLFFTN